MRDLGPGPENCSVLKKLLSLKKSLLIHDNRPWSTYVVVLEVSFLYFLFVFSVSCCEIECFVYIH